MICLCQPSTFPFWGFSSTVGISFLVFLALYPFYYVSAPSQAHQVWSHFYKSALHWQNCKSLSAYKLALLQRMNPSCCPIGLSVRAYILVSPIALGKSLLARPHLNPWIKLLSDPRAYASSPYWLLLSITKPHSHTPLRHINVPAQHAYASSPDWSPQSRCCLSPGVNPFMTL